MEDGGFDLPDPTFFPGGNELNTVRSFYCSRCIHATPQICTFDCSRKKGMFGQYILYMIVYGYL